MVGLAAGPPPLVFTLGSLAVAAPGSFYGEAVAIARQIGMRAVLLTGGAPVVSAEHGANAAAVAIEASLETY